MPTTFPAPESCATGGFLHLSSSGRLKLISRASVRDDYAEFVMDADRLSRSDALRYVDEQGPEALRTWFNEQFDGDCRSRSGRLVQKASPDSLRQAFPSLADSDLREMLLAAATDASSGEYARADLAHLVAHGFRIAEEDLKPPHGKWCAFRSPMTAFAHQLVVNILQDIDPYGAYRDVYPVVALLQRNEQCASLTFVSSVVASIQNHADNMSGWDGACERLFTSAAGGPGLIQDVVELMRECGELNEQALEQLRAAFCFRDRCSTEGRNMVAAIVTRELMELRIRSMSNELPSVDAPTPARRRGGI